MYKEQHVFGLPSEALDPSSGGCIGYLYNKSGEDTMQLLNKVNISLKNDIESITY